MLLFSLTEQPAFLVQISKAALIILPTSEQWHSQIVAMISLQVWARCELGRKETEGFKSW